MQVANKIASDIPPERRQRGRPKGAPNKTTTVLKDAILAAGEAVGEDQRGKDGLQGYLVFLAKAEPKSFATLLGKVLPLQVVGRDEGPVQVTDTCAYDVILGRLALLAARRRESGDDQGYWSTQEAEIDVMTRTEIHTAGP